MATLDAPDFIHNNSRVDIIDSLSAPFFAIAGFATLLEATISLTFLGVSFAMSDVVWSLGGLDLTWAWLTTTLVLGVVWATNEVRSYDEEWRRYIPVAMLVIHFVVLFPTGHDIVVSSDHTTATSATIVACSSTSARTSSVLSISCDTAGGTHERGGRVHDWSLALNY